MTSADHFWQFHAGYVDKKERRDGKPWLAQSVHYRCGREYAFAKNKQDPFAEDIMAACEAYAELVGHELTDADRAVIRGEQ